MRCTHARSLAALTVLGLIAASTSCTPRGGRGGGSGDDDDDDTFGCGDADEALQLCYERAGIGDTFSAFYCPATELDPGSAGYMGPGTDWGCIVAAWDGADCASDGGWEDAAACDVDPGGDDDDSTPPGDDDDSTPPGDDDDDSTPPSGASTGTLPCGDGTVVDVWTFAGSAGASVEVLVDTTSASTAFDPFAAIWNGAPPGGTELAFGDDEFPCTYPPPEYNCPNPVTTLSSGGTHYVVVGHASDNCAGTTAAYALSIAVNGANATATLASDDTVLPPP